MTALPVIDNDDVRKENSKKIADSFEAIGDFVKIYRREKKIGIVTGLIVFGFVLFVVGGGFLYALYNSGWDVSVLFNTDATSIDIFCVIENQTAKFNSPGVSLQFKELFPNSTCTFIPKISRKSR